MIVIGMNPGNGGSTLKTLNKWIEAKHYSFTNVCIRKGKVRVRDYDLKRLCTECQNYDKIIALGKIASDALTRLGINHFCLPHPSGLNRQLNDKEFINDRLNELRIYCGGGSPSDSQVV